MLTCPEGTVLVAENKDKQELIRNKLTKKIPHTSNRVNVKPLSYSISLWSSTPSCRSKGDTFTFLQNFIKSLERFKRSCDIKKYKQMKG